MRASLLLGVIGLLLSGCGTQTPQDDQAVVVPSKERKDVGPSGLKHFALFHGSPEPVPTALETQLPPIGGLWNMSQRIMAFPVEAWAVPGQGRLCLVTRKGREAPSVACARLTRVLEAGMFIASVPASDPQASSFRSVIGLVPNGVSKVRIHAGDAHPKTVPVVENVFALRDHGRAFPESIDLVRGG